MTLRRLALLLLLATLAAAGCTRAKPAPETATSTGLATSTTSSSPSTTDTAGSTTGPATQPTATRTVSATARPSTSAPSRPPVVTPAGCATSALTITVERGSGAAGHQFATLVFANRSSTACSLTGYPGVVLLVNGSPLGQPATRSGATFAQVNLAPGGSAMSPLQNDSTCNAANSDSVQVIVPNRTEKTVLPLRLRGCPLTVGPVTRR
jgi:hypothetical protein